MDRCLWRCSSLALGDAAQGQRLVTRRPLSVSLVSLVHTRFPPALPVFPHSIIRDLSATKPRSLPDCRPFCLALRLLGRLYWPVLAETKTPLLELGAFFLACACACVSLGEQYLPPTCFTFLVPFLYDRLFVFSSLSRLSFFLSLRGLEKNSRYSPGLSYLLLFCCSCFGSELALMLCGSFGVLEPRRRLRLTSHDERRRFP